MKHLILSLALMLTISLASAQTIKEPRNTDKVLKDTVIKEVKYTLYLGSRGGKYYIKPNAKGELTKRYIKHK